MVDTEYEVEAIIGKRTIRGQVQYKIKWLNYEDNESTWEPISNLSCNILIKQYEESIKHFIKMYIATEAIESRRMA